ncbi:MAG: Single-stranded DNA-binding protein ssb [Pelotomaculum sp. PtaB.Bin104]|nr:MAG: Single-stranded DNA-binding protein ssb [Pelotomaculum sp. PtaB.Bin104]
MFQKWIGCGRLTKDPELKHLSDGTAVAKFTVAVDRLVSKEAKEKGDKATADFIDVVVWRKQAENVSKYRKKGDPILVEGVLQIRSYDDKEGIRRKAAEIVASRVVFLPNGKKNAEDAPWPEEAPPENGGGKEAPGDGGFPDFDDIPF